MCLCFWSSDEHHLSLLDDQSSQVQQRTRIFECMSEETSWFWVELSWGFGFCLKVKINNERSLFISSKNFKKVYSQTKNLCWIYFNRKVNLIPNQILFFLRKTIFQQRKWHHHKASLSNTNQHLNLFQWKFPKKSLILNYLKQRLLFYPIIMILQIRRLLLSGNHKTKNDSSSGFLWVINQRTIPFTQSLKMETESSSCYPQRTFYFKIHIENTFRFLTLN